MLKCHHEYDYLKAYMPSYHMHSLYSIHYNKNNTIPDVNFEEYKIANAFMPAGRLAAAGNNAFQHNYYGANNSHLKLITYSKYKNDIIMNVFNVTVVHSL